MNTTIQPGKQIIIKVPILSAVFARLSGRSWLTGQPQSRKAKREKLVRRMSEITGGALDKVAGFKKPDGVIDQSRIQQFMEKFSPEVQAKVLTEAQRRLSMPPAMRPTKKNKPKRGCRNC